MLSLVMLAMNRGQEAQSVPLHTAAASALSTTQALQGLLNNTTVKDLNYFYI